MLYNIIVLEPSMSFHYDHITVTVTCDSVIMLNPNPKSPNIENKGKIK